MITRRLMLILALLVCWSAAAIAQTASAEDYFNRAGKEYVKEDKRAALRTLDQGLQRFPGDVRLLKLAEELLKEEQQKQEQQQQEQQQKEQQQKEDEKKQKQEQQQQEEQEKQQREEQQQAEENEADPKDRKPEPGRIAPQDAKRILDALERGEMDVQQKVRERQRPDRRVPVEKDW